MSDSGSGNPRAERLEFDTWSPELLAWFDGRALAEKTGFTASLVTRNLDGRLGTSLLGIGELYAPDAGALRLALWAQARAARALAGDAGAALTFVFDGAFYQVQLDVAPLVSAQAEAAGLLLVQGGAERGAYSGADQADQPRAAPEGHAGRARCRLAGGTGGRAGRAGRARGAHPAAPSSAQTRSTAKA